MSMPVYVAPEQQMKDRADFARKGIARGRSVVVLRYAEGICFVAENRSQALHKVSEIYDRIGFAAVGRYNEFENLRIAGIRHADMRGYSYDRADVTGRGLANAYAQLLGTIFSSGAEKPYEVEIIVAELGQTAATDQIYRLTYDGSVGDEAHFAVMGGNADEIAQRIAEHYADSAPLDVAVRNAVRGLSGDGEQLSVEALEVAVLDRTRTQPRKFRRLRAEQLAEFLDAGGAADAPADPATDRPTEASLSKAGGSTSAAPAENGPADDATGTGEAPDEATE